jgi:hypothetical protein
VAGRGRERGAARALERGTALLEEAAERSRPRTVAERLKANVCWFAQAALSTALAWALAQALFGHTRPIFAAMGALIGVSATPGQRRRSAAETVLGVALGIGIADALVVMIGDGTLQLAAIVAGAMVAAVALGGGPVLVTEAAAGALLVVTVEPLGSGLSGARLPRFAAGRRRGADGHLAAAGEPRRGCAARRRCWPKSQASSRTSPERSSAATAILPKARSRGLAPSIPTPWTTPSPPDARRCAWRPSMAPRAHGSRATRAPRARSTRRLPASRR